MLPITGESALACRADASAKADLKQVLQQIVGEAGGSLDGMHHSSYQASGPGLTGASIGFLTTLPIEKNAHRGTRRTCMFLNDATGFPPRVAGL